MSTFQELLLKDENNNICDLNKKTPISRRGSMTTKRDDQHLECAYHYIAFEIYFNSFSLENERKCLLVVSIKIVMGAYYV